MKMPRLIFAVMAICCLAVQAKAATTVKEKGGKPLVLVKDGAPEAMIICEAPPEGFGAKPDASLDVREKRAFIKEQELRDKPYIEQVQIPAQDLQHYLKLITGATLPLVTDGEELPGQLTVQIHVGRTTESLKANPDAPSGFDPKPGPNHLGEEGYLIRTKPNRIYLVGNQDGPYMGTAYAVYDLLHRLGVRWYFPGEWGEIVPRKKTLAAPALEVRSTPDFAIRVLWYDGFVRATKDEKREFRWWQIRNRMNASPRGRNGFNHFYPRCGDGFLGFLLPPKEFAEEHPEYYAMNIKGEQPHWGKGNKPAHARHTMLCLSNPDVLEQSAKNLREAFAGEREMAAISPNGFGFSPPDGAPMCYCPECQKKSYNFRFPAYYQAQTHSTPYFQFAVELAKRFPDKMVTLMAYSNREPPPQGIEKFPSNIAIKYAPITSDVLHPINHPTAWRKQEEYKILKTYTDMCEHIVYRDYTPGLLLTNYIPERDAENFAQDIKIFKKLGVRGFYPEGRKAWMATWLSYYVRARMSWNSERDLDSIKQEFYGNFFGPAAKPVRAWWDACAERLLEADIQAHEDWLLNNIYTLDFVESIRPHIEKARKLATNSPYRERVTAVSLIADNLAGYAEMWGAERRLDYTAALAGAEKMYQAKVALHELYPHFINPKSSRGRRPFMCYGNNKRLQGLVDQTSGKTGKQVAPIPETARFTLDPYNEGVFGRWFEPAHPDNDWQELNTFLFWEQQMPFLDEKGHDQNGLGWYRIEVNIPANYRDKPLRLWLGGALNEAWVWVNGKFVGHREYKFWWRSPRTVDVDISEAAKPGKNLIAVRIHNNAEIGGLYRRGFIYQPLTE